MNAPDSNIHELALLLTTIDEFLRSGDGVAELLADFHARRGDPHPYFAATNLIDAVSFTAHGLGCRVGTVNPEINPEGEHW